MHATLKCLAFAGALLAGGPALAVTLSNDTVQVNVLGGDAGRDMGDAGGYFFYTLTGADRITYAVDPLLRLADGTVVTLAKDFAPAVATPDGAETSALSFGISSHANSILDGNTVRTTFTFAAAPSATLAGSSFIFYVDTDLPNLSSNTASFSGSIATGDLVLRQRGYSAAVQFDGVAGAGSTLSLFGAGRYRDWTNAIGAGDLGAMSSDGSNFGTQGDLAMALAFSLSGTSASLVVNYGALALPVPEPDAWAMLFGGLLVLPIFARRNGRKHRAASHDG